MSRLAGHGLGVDLPAGWDGRIFRHDEGEATLHAASFALPPGADDYAASAVQRMPRDGVLVVLTEFRARLAGTGLYAAQGLPRRLRADELSPAAVHPMRTGLAAVQRFLTEGGRPFCLYVVVGEAAPGRARLLRQALAVVRTIEVEPRA